MIRCSRRCESAMLPFGHVITVYLSVLLVSCYQALSKIVCTDNELGPYQSRIFSKPDWWMQVSSGTYFNAIVLSKDGKAILASKDSSKRTCLGNFLEEVEVRSKRLLDQFIKISSFYMHRFVLLAAQFSTSCDNLLVLLPTISKYCRTMGRIE